MEIKSVGVVGCGLMGHGIAQVCAQKGGWDVVVTDISAEQLEKGMAKVEKQLARAVEKGKLEQADADAVRGRITTTEDRSDLAECDLVIEAISEDLASKLELWKELDGIVKEEALFATNTSSLSVAEQAGATSRPGQFLGLHFFNPAQVMPLLEVVKADGTDEATAEAGFSFGEKLGKTTVAAGDNRGFIVNRLLVPYMLDAIRALEAGIASVDDIDKGMQLGAGHPMGPFTLLDFVGLDTTYKIAEIMFDEYREPRYAPPPLLRRMVVAGLHGRKSGRGFYDYAANPPVPIDLGL